MEKHTVKSYDKELETIVGNITDMGKLVKEIILIANDSLQNPGNSHTERAFATDKEINKLDEKIESAAITMIALRQPMAIDLRKIVGALKVAVIMERMGDLSKNVTKRIGKVNFSTSKQNLVLIQKMNNLSVGMLQDALDSLIHLNLEKALSVYLRDEDVDDTYDILIENLQEQLSQNPKDTKSIMQIIFAVKNFERFADYITKIATISHFVITGEKKFNI